MPTSSLAPAPTGGLDFTHIRSGTSSVDALWENNGGYASFADYCRSAARSQGRERSVQDERYQRWSEASTTYRRWAAQQDHPSVARAVSSPDGMYEMSDPDGGNLIPPGFVKSVFDKARFRNTPLSRVRVVNVSSPSGMWPSIAESSRVDGSRWGGLLSYWENEAQQLTGTFPTLANNQYRCKKLTALVPVTDELFADSALLEPFLDEVVPKEFMYQTNEAVVNGNGVGRPLGVVNNPATITVPKDVGQATHSVTYANLQAMWTQSHGPSRANMCWYAQEDIDPESVVPPVGTATAWAPPTESPSLKGRPFLPLENCQAIGTPGDVVLGDWSQYALAFLGMRKTISMHFHFDRYESYFRYTWRVDGQCLWYTPLTPPHSTIPKSPFLVLAPR